MLIDAHCHVDQYTDPTAIAREAERDGMVVVAVTNTPIAYEEAVRHLSRYRGVISALGIHPRVQRNSTDLLGAFLRLQGRATHIGEIGLHYSGLDEAERARQRRILEEVLRATHRSNKVHNIHAVGAAEDIFAMLSDYKCRHVVMHWYSGPTRLVDELLSIGCLFSINQAMMRSPKGRHIAAMLPMGRVLTETDGPYVRVSSAPARPRDVELLLRQLAHAWDLTEGETEAQIASNFCGLTEMG